MHSQRNRQNWLPALFFDASSISSWNLGQCHFHEIKIPFQNSFCFKQTNGHSVYFGVFVVFFVDWKRRLSLLRVFFLLYLLQQIQMMWKEKKNTNREKNRTDICLWFALIFCMKRKCLHGNKWHFRCIFGTKR